MALSLPENYVLHSDTTSHVLYGDYSQNEEDEEPALRITYGYSKDKRVELTEVKIDGEIKTIFLNLTPELQETLTLIGLSHLFQQEQVNA
jgi:hypothetical protein